MQAFCTYCYIYMLHVWIYVRQLYTAAAIEFGKTHKKDRFQDTPTFC